MKRKVLFLAAVFYGVAIILSGFQSCDFGYDAFICNIDFFGYKNYSFSKEPDDLTSTIKFIIEADNNCKTASILQNINPINACFATHKSARWQNDIVESSFNLSFDKQIIIKNDSIKPGMNILANEYVKLNSKIDKKSHSNYIESTITFNDTLRSQMIFDSGIYTATFTCETTDGKHLAKKRKIVFLGNQHTN